MLQKMKYAQKVDSHRQLETCLQSGVEFGHIQLEFCITTLAEIGGNRLQKERTLCRRRRQAT
jgi:hypothetical protein